MHSGSGSPSEGLWVAWLHKQAQVSTTPWLSLNFTASLRKLSWSILMNALVPHTLSVTYCCQFKDAVLPHRPDSVTVNMTHSARYVPGQGRSEGFVAPSQLTFYCQTKDVWPHLIMRWLWTWLNLQLKLLDKHHFRARFTPDWGQIHTRLGPDLVLIWSSQGQRPSGLYMTLLLHNGFVSTPAGLSWHVS